MQKEKEYFYFCIIDIVIISNDIYNDNDIITVKHKTLG